MLISTRFAVVVVAWLDFDLTRLDYLLWLSGEEEEGGVIVNRFSRNLTQKKSQGASQAMLYATGLTTEDMKKAQVRHDTSSLAVRENGIIRMI